MLGIEPRTLHVLGKHFTTVLYYTHCLCGKWIYHYHPHACEDWTACVKDLIYVEPQMVAVVIDDNPVSGLLRTFSQNRIECTLPHEINLIYYHRLNVKCPPAGSCV